MVGPGALEAAAGIASGRWTAEELAGRCLDRIAERDPDLHAWARISATAIEEARELDRQEPRGPLHGVPIAVKDIIDTGGLGTECGSAMHVGNVPVADACCVAALRHAGCVIIGKTVTSEFATGRSGPTRNPWMPEHTPGGSSSGSAAAVADGHVPVALGTQTSGSIARPAAYCRVVGFKPTHDLVSRRGVHELAPELDTVGALARAPEDAFVAVEVMAGRTPSVERNPGSPVRIGWSPTPWWSALTPTGGDGLLAAVADLRRRGWHLPDVALPSSLADIVEVQQVLFDVGISRALGPAWRRDPERFSPQLRSKLEQASRRTDEHHHDALAQRDRIATAFASVWDEVDVLLVPVVDGPPPLGLGSTGDPLLCRGWTALGYPTMTLPSPPGADGIPIGWQLVGPTHHDARLVAPARQLLDAIIPPQEHPREGTHRHDPTGSRTRRRSRQSRDGGHADPAGCR